MDMQNIEKLGALGMVAVAMAVVSYLAIMGNEQAQGSIIGAVSAGIGFFLRGKVQV